jgi:hypothetical protein
MRHTIVTLIAIFSWSAPAWCADPVPAAAGNVGDLVLAFEFDGQPPQLAPLAGPVPAGCKGPLADPALVVGPQGGVRDVLVSLFIKPGEKPPAFPPPPVNGPTINNKNCEFVPHMVVLQTGSKLTLGNLDNIPHAVNLACTVNQVVNQTLPGQAQLNLTLARPERLPIRVSCPIHPFMSGWVVLSDHPYVAASDPAGQVVIKNIPVGNYTFRAWHERVGFVIAPKKDGAAQNWSYGKFEVKIAKGVNNLGLFKVRL